MDNAIAWTVNYKDPKDRVFTHHHLKNRDELTPNQVTSVFAIAFTQDGGIWAVERGDGRCGSPGGGVEEDGNDPDLTLADTAWREAKEEIGVLLDKNSLQIVRHIKTESKDKTFPKPYMTIMTGFVQDVIPKDKYKPQGANGRFYFKNSDEFLEKYNTGDKPSMIRMIAEAKELLFGTPVPKTHSLKSLKLVA